MGQLSDTIIRTEIIRNSIQGCDNIEELFLKMGTYYGDVYSILDTIIADIKGRNYVKVSPGQTSRQAMLDRINILQENLFSKNRYFPENKLTRTNAMQSLQSICTEEQSEYGSAILNQYKLAIRSPAPDENGILQDYETLLLKCTTDLRQDILDTISIERIGFIKGRSRDVTQEYNGRAKQINAFQKQPYTNDPIQQTEPNFQYKQNVNKKWINNRDKRVGVEITELSPCILCKGSHGLYNCPKIDDVKRGTLKLPPNICYQHCNIKSSKCKTHAKQN